MKKVFKTSLFLLLFFVLNCCSQKSAGLAGSSPASENAGLKVLPLIPLPQKLTEKRGQFKFDSSVRIKFDQSNSDIAAAAAFLNDLFGPSAGFRFQTASAEESKENLIVLTLIDSEGSKGSYSLNIGPQRIEIKANSAAGIFYGIQSIRQLLPPQIESRKPVSGVSWTVPCLAIEDSPRFSYRGLHLDVCRHFFPPAFIKKYIDLLALHKMNTFHWHLTEDQGWRIEIEKYPKLTEIGAYRKETLIGHAGRPPLKYDGKRYGGFYTQDEIRDIVSYAKSRFVTIIPEIEMPGHSSAALASYPELGCTGGPYKVQTRWGVFDDVYCAGNDSVFVFMQDVLDEICELFPGKYIHIGGDECPKKSWEECPKCQARIKNEGLHDEHELQSYFIQRIEKYLLTKNRYIIGWDEILEGGLAPQATVMSWRGMAGGIEAARQKHDVIMTPGTHCYLDHYQADPESQPLAIGGFTPLKKIYSFEPVPAELMPQESKYILGAQGNVWTEYMKTSDHVEYMAYPRACALAEVVWSAIDSRDYKNFLGRMESHYKRLAAMGVNYFYQVEKPFVQSEKVFFLDKASIELQKPFDNSEIRFTIDGSRPYASSSLYKNNIKLTESAQIKAVTINKKTGESSPVLNINVKKLEYIQPSDNAPQTQGLKLTHHKGRFASVSSLDTISVFAAGTSEGFRIPETKETDFGLHFSGFIKIDQQGIYDFRLTSDDGSKLFLAGQEFIDNDGRHAPKSVYSSAALKAGYYLVELKYFQVSGRAELELAWKFEGSEYSEIPAERLFH